MSRAMGDGWGMRAWLAGLAALALLAACGEEEPTADARAAVELCEIVQGTSLAPERWGACSCFAGALMELPAGGERLAGANWMVAELGYPILALSEGKLPVGQDFLARTGLGNPAALKDWYQGYAARVQPSAEVTQALIQASGARLTQACVK